MTQNIGRYEIIEEIGHGGFAKVYKAQDTVLDRLIAIKVMHPALMSDTSFVSRFQQEAKIIASLQHPHIISIHDYGEFEGRLFLVMKLMESSVHTRLQQGVIPWHETKKIVNQISSALDFAHSKDVIHRDIKPENILLDENKNAVIADFGLVKALKKSSLSVSLSSNDILGTTPYLPPEVWNGEDVTPATDIYALACVVYEMVTGNKLFQGPTPPATMTLHFRPPQFPSTWPDGIPSGIVPLLEKSLDQNPLERFTNAGDFAEALDSLTEDLLTEKYIALNATFDAKNWVEAISLAAMILEEAPNYKDVQNILQKAIKEKSEDEKLLLINQGREQAQEAIAQEESPSTTTAAQKLKQLAPDDPVVNPTITDAVEKQRNLQKDANKAKKIPKWVWGIFILFTILLSIWGLNQLFGNNNANIVEDIISSTPNHGEEIVPFYTETPTFFPTDLPPKTPTSFPSKTPIQPATTPTIQPSPTILPVSMPSPTPETYIVQAGDSLPAIAQAQNVDWDDFLALNNISDPVSYNGSLRPGDSLLLPPRSEADTQKVTYRVQSGDTYSSIAEKFGIDVALLMSANPTKESFYPGDKLYIPWGVYIVRAGDTFRQIALDHDVTVDELVEANKEVYPELLLDSNYFQVGWELKIPQQDEESANNVANAIDCAPSPPRTEVISHTVQTGEGMTCLVLKFGVSEPTLLNANPELWEEPDIPSGSTLLIPPTNGALYILTDEDIENDVTLVDIAWWYDVSDSNFIVTWQGQQVPLPVQAGQQLFIPGDGLIANPYDVIIDKGLATPLRLP